MMSRISRTTILIATIILSACTPNKEKSAQTGSSQIVSKEQSDFRIIADQQEQDTIKGSIKARAMGTVGDAISINYYSPAVRGRIIWGGLVPYDQVWVTGAHRATNIEFDGDMTIGDTSIPAGRYAIFTIPGKTEWTFILNKNWDQHLADDYDSNQDMVRIKITPITSQQPQERLQYTINTLQDRKGTIKLMWEKVAIEVPFSAQ
ncbi:MAG: DUF2911 domain-containing protein [Cyclobacteriaceae bacterium]|nr:DUF2911 domain-containing protein [Cyclobacteriaceae bacterium]